MAKPIIKKIDPFDAAITDYTVRFIYNGNQTYGSIMNVYNANTMQVVYSKTVSNMRSENYIPRGTLSNGTGSPMKYCVNIVSVDKDGNKSAVSEFMYFWCLTTPVLTFADPVFPSDEDDPLVISNSNISVRVSYYQAQNDEIYQLQFFLYDSAGRLQYESDIRHDVGDDNLTCTFTGLDNGADSYVEAVVLTRTGMVARVKRKLYTLYQQPSAYARLYATSENEDGIVNWWTNIVAIEPTRDSDEYEYNDGYINLLNDWITYNSNYKIEGDFVMSFGHRFEKTDVTLLETNAFKLELLDTGSNSYVYKLTAPGILSKYVIYSDVITGLEYHDDLVVHVRRVDNIYELKVFEFFGGNNAFFTHDLYLGRQPAYSSLTTYDAWFEDITLPSNTHMGSVGANTHVADNEPTGLPQYSIWLGG